MVYCVEYCVTAQDAGRMVFNQALIDCVHVYGLLLGFYEDDAFVLLFYLLCMIVLCMCCLSGVITNINNKVLLRANDYQHSVKYTMHIPPSSSDSSSESISSLISKANQHDALMYACEIIGICHQLNALMCCGIILIDIHLIAAGGKVHPAYSICCLL